MISLIRFWLCTEIKAVLVKPDKLPIDITVAMTMKHTKTNNAKGHTKVRNN